ncbi:uroporphyrinogen-III synthase [Orrella sp. JC864]|uniref:uroporphyrinogen-III synthase n=1 Tax=Orrella sp. JC864 TaxID=3120298 RepID=UPI0030098FC8
MSGAKPELAVLTRPEGRNEALAARLRQAGWQVLVQPALRIEALDPPELPHPRDYDLVVLVSGNAARLYFSCLRRRYGGFVWPQATAAAVVGAASAAAVQAQPGWNRRAALVSPLPQALNHDSEALWQAMQAGGLRPQRVLLVRGEHGRDWLAQRLAGQGARVQTLALYRRLPQSWPQSTLLRLRQAAQAQQPAAWLITSAEGLAAVREQARARGLAQWLAGCPAVVTHPRLAPLWQAGPADTFRNDARAKAMVKICLPEEGALARGFAALR